MIKFGGMGDTRKKQELTDRQKEILNLLRKGLTNSEICFALNISANTVKVHLANIYKILEVTNRTEAVSVTMDSPETSETNGTKQEIVLTICHNDDFQDYPLAHSLFLSIIEALQGCNIFQIKIRNADEYEGDNDYTIQLATPQNEDESLFIALQQTNNGTLLWSNLQRIQRSEDIELHAEQIAIQLYRHVILSAAEAYKASPNISPRWWYGSCHSIMKMENRSKEEFEKCEKLQQELIESEGHKDFSTAALVAAYYVASTENWISASECTEKMKKIANESMREYPASTYSLYSMALYNMFIGNNRIAIDYFESVVRSKGPLHIICRRMLSQLYTQVGREPDALAQLAEYDRLLPSSMYQPFQYVAKAFLHFMQGEFNSCKKVSEQILMFHPEIPYARLLMIACTFRENNLEERKKHMNMLFRYNPNFSTDDLNRFLNCFSPAQRGQIASYLENLF